MLRLLTVFAADEGGATAIEYGIMASMIALVLVGALSATGDGVMAKWNFVMNKVIQALGGGSPEGGEGGEGA